MPKTTARNGAIQFEAELRDLDLTAVVEVAWDWLRGPGDKITPPVDEFSVSVGPVVRVYRERCSVVDGKREILTEPVRVTLLGLEAFTGFIGLAIQLGRGPLYKRILSQCRAAAEK